MFELSEIRRLIDALRQAQIAELDVEKDGWRVRIRREQGEPVAPVSGAAAPVKGIRVQDDPVSAQSEDASRTVIAPGYGVFHPAASPDDPPYVQLGQAVKEGQKVGIIEAMKVFSSIVSPFSGCVAEIYVGDGEEVQAGARLFRLT